MLALLLAGLATVGTSQRSGPIPADEVTLRREIYKDSRATVFLLDIPPGSATLLHRHDRDMLSIFVAKGSTRASFDGAEPFEDTFVAGDVRFRSAGFTHSTENLGATHFLAVIFELAPTQGQRIQPTRPPMHACNPGTETACTDDKPLFCTTQFCVDEVTIAPRAIKSDNAAATDQMLIAVSDFTLSEQTAAEGAIVRAKKTGEIQPIPAGPGRRWTNIGDVPSHFVVVSYR